MSLAKKKISRLILYVNIPQILARNNARSKHVDQNAHARGMLVHWLGHVGLQSIQDLIDTLYNGTGRG